MIILMLLLGIYCGNVAGRINQIFPSDFSCPAGPSFRWKCMFPVGATTVLWSFPGIASIPDDYPGHKIDNNMMDIGVSYLEVNSFSESKESYRCIAVFLSTTLESSQRRLELANMTMDCSHEELNRTSIRLIWDNRHPECFTNFSVWVNGVENGNTNHNNYTLTGLNAEITYNVCVIAMDNGGNTQRNWMDCENITLTTTGCTSCGCFCFSSITGIVLCIVIPICIGICLIMMVLSAILGWICKRCCCDKAGKIHDGGKHQTNIVEVDMEKGGKGEPGLGVEPPGKKRVGCDVKEANSNTGQPCPAGHPDHKGQPARDKRTSGST